MEKQLRSAALRGRFILRYNRRARGDATNSLDYMPGDNLLPDFPQAVIEALVEVRLHAKQGSVSSSLNTATLKRIRRVHLWALIRVLLPEIEIAGGESCAKATKEEQAGRQLRQ